MGRCLRSAITMVLVLAVLTGQVTGCAAPEVRGRPAARTTADSTAPMIPAEIRSSNGADALLRYGALLRSIPAEALEREHTRVSDAFARDASASNRIRLALLLSVPVASFRDNARARDLLQQVLDESGSGARQYHGVAGFLAAMLDDQKQLEGALADERRQRQELQQKLEQLKAIEQDTGTRIPPKPTKER